LGFWIFDFFLNFKINLMSKLIILLTFALLLNSCGKDDNVKETSEKEKNQTQEENSDESDSTMTVEEAFSTALVQDIIGNQEDPELQIYLEEQIYPIASKSDKVTIDKISSSLYLLSYNDNGAMKNILIQKFYNPVEDEFIFESRDTDANSLKQFVR
jgi:PBP1b-binding outer membrane lipoprotein LpoB